MKYFTLLSLLTIIINSIIAQDTIYLDANYDKIDDKKNAIYYQVLKYEDANTMRASRSIYFMSGQLKMLKNYSNLKNQLLDGKYELYFDNGNINENIDYINGMIDGQLLTYWPNGIAKRIDKYKEGKLVEGKCFSRTGKDTTYFEYEIIPQFPGGEGKSMNFLYRNMMYPAEARHNDIQGRVIIGFLVNEDGSISDIKIVRGVHKSLDDESLRVIKLMPNWTPAQHDGEKIKARYTIPITYKLE